MLKKLKSRLFLAEIKPGELREELTQLCEETYEEALKIALTTIPNTK
jgi:hypothetical protein